jgi:TIR domain-containing protein
MAGGIFVSYRRDDSRHAAGRLLDRLRQAYKPRQLFMDVYNLAPGLDFAKEISRQVEACDAMLVVIGPGWLDARGENGARRLDDPDDFVRIEVEAALKRDVRVIPVLVDGAPSPRESDLPKVLRPLARRQSIRLTHERFDTDADELLRWLRDIVKPNQGGLRGLVLGSVGALIGIILGLCSFLPLLVFVPPGTHSPTVAAVLAVGLAVWFPLMVWLAKSAAGSTFKSTSSAACFAAALFCVGGLTIWWNQNLPAGEALILFVILTILAIAAYALFVRISLWRSLVGSGTR